VRVLVTGGSGFIGSHVVDRLLQDGHDPAILDPVSPPAHLATVEHHAGDILDADALRGAVAGCDAVIHLAAIADAAATAAWRAPLRPSSAWAFRTGRERVGPVWWPPSSAARWRASR
jgi:nucleoside-diphosphate-sugar epimerase